MDIKTFRRATPSSVGRSGKIGGLSEVCWASYRKTKGLIVRKAISPHYQPFSFPIRSPANLTQTTDLS